MPQTTVNLKQAVLAAAGMLAQTLQLLATAVMAQQAQVAVAVVRQGLTLVVQAAQVGLELSSFAGLLFFVRQRPQRVPQQ
jgi:hypothetical protein